MRVARRAGASPQRSAVASETMKVNPSTRASGATFKGKGSSPWGTMATSPLPAHPANTIPKAAACQGEQQILGKHLADQARPAGSERHAHRDLPLARRGARQQEVGNVGADDQQDQAHDGHQDLQGQFRPRSECAGSPRSIGVSSI